MRGGNRPQLLIQFGGRSLARQQGRGQQKKSDGKRTNLRHGEILACPAISPGRGIPGRAFAHDNEEARGASKIQGLRFDKIEGAARAGRVALVQ